MEKQTYHKPMPAIQRDAIIPPRPETRQPTILRLELEGCDLLKGVFLCVPLDADVIATRPEEFYYLARATFVKDEAEPEQA